MDLAAADWRPAAVFVQAGTSDRGATVAGAGARWPLACPALGPRVGLALELGLARWSAPQEAGGRRAFVQFTATPLLRWRGHTSPWFLEAGIGVSYHARDYVAKAAHQGTRWNFNDVLGVGLNLGAHEVGLRVAHFSNAGLKEPNPGDSSVSLRWSLSY